MCPQLHGKKFKEVLHANHGQAFTSNTYVAAYSTYTLKSIGKIFTFYSIKDRKLSSMIIQGKTPLLSVTERGNPSKKPKHGGVRNPIDLDVVLEAFQEFVTQYK